MRTVILANGAAYDCEWASAKPAELGLSVITGDTLLSLATAFGDPANTARIELRSDGAEPRTYEGYTDLRVLNAGGWKEGSTLIILKKEA